MNEQIIDTSSLSEKPMSLVDARKVLWLSNDRRPLGKLLDEGYLNLPRLKWAAEKAYDQRLRQAAKVLYDWQLNSQQDELEQNKLIASKLPDTLPQIDITIEMARATIWPFYPFKGQLMGPLVETKQISLKDLGYAIENAWDNRVRQSANALLLIRMQQIVNDPPPEAGFLHVISNGRSYAERQQLRLTFLEGIFIGALLTACIVLLINTFPRILTSWHTISWSIFFSSIIGIITLVIILIVGFSFLWWLDYVINRIENSFAKQINNHRLGQEGEDRVVEIMRQSLDGNWHLFRNVILPGRNKGDLDAVLVGPSAVLALEIKSYNGEYRNIEDRWEYRKGNIWKSAKVNPSQQATGNAIRLANFLKTDGIQQWVTAVVVWVNQESLSTVNNPTTTVWKLDRLADELGNLCWESKQNIKREVIVNKLTQLCKK